MLNRKDKRSQVILTLLTIVLLLLILTLILFLVGADFPQKLTSYFNVLVLEKNPLETILSFLFFSLVVIFVIYFSRTFAGRQNFAEKNKLLKIVPFSKIMSISFLFSSVLLVLLVIFLVPSSDFGESSFIGLLLLFGGIFVFLYPLIELIYFSIKEPELDSPPFQKFTNWCVDNLRQKTATNSLFSPLVVFMLFYIIPSFIFGFSRWFLFVSFLLVAYYTANGLIPKFRPWIFYYQFKNPTVILEGVIPLISIIFTLLGHLKLIDFQFSFLIVKIFANIPVEVPLVIMNLIISMTTLFFMYLLLRIIFSLSIFEKDRWVDLLEPVYFLLSIAILTIVFVASLFPSFTEYYPLINNSFSLLLDFFSQTIGPTLALVGFFNSVWNEKIKLRLYSYFYVVYVLTIITFQILLETSYPFVLFGSYPGEVTLLLLSASTLLFMYFGLNKELSGLDTDGISRRSFGYTGSHDQALWFRKTIEDEWKANRGKIRLIFPNILRFNRRKFSNSDIIPMEGKYQVTEWLYNENSLVRVETLKIIKNWPLDQQLSSFVYRKILLLVRDSDIFVRQHVYELVSRWPENERLKPTFLHRLYSDLHHSKNAFLITKTIDFVLTLPDKYKKSPEILDRVLNILNNNRFKDAHRLALKYLRILPPTELTDKIQTVVLLKLHSEKTQIQLEALELIQLWPANIQRQENIQNAIKKCLFGGNITVSRKASEIISNWSDDETFPADLIQQVLDHLNGDRHDKISALQVSMTWTYDLKFHYGVLTKIKEFLSEPDWTLRKAAISALQGASRFSEIPDELSERLLDCLNDEHSEVIIEVLSEINFWEKEEIPIKRIITVIERALSQKDRQSRFYFLGRLITWRHNEIYTAEIRKLILEQISDKDVTIRSYALELLSKWPEKYIMTDELKFLIIKMMNDKNGSVRSSAMKVIKSWTLNYQTRPEIRRLIVEKFDDEALIVRAQILWTIRNWPLQSQLTQDIISLVKEALHDDSPIVVGAALQIIGIWPYQYQKDPEITSIVQSSLNSTSKRVRELALKVIGSYDASIQLDSQIIEKMLGMAKNDDWQVQNIAFKILTKRFNNGVSEFLTTEIILSILESKDHRFLSTAIYYLKNLPKTIQTHPKIISKLTNLLEHDIESVRSHVLYIFSLFPLALQLQPNIKEEILKKLEDRGWKIRKNALKIITEWPDRERLSIDVINRVRPLLNDNWRIQGTLLGVILGWPDEHDLAPQLQNTILEKVMSDSKETYIALTIIKMWPDKYKVQPAVKAKILNLLNDTRSLTQWCALEVIQTWPKEDKSDLTVVQILKPLLNNSDLKLSAHALGILYPITQINTKTIEKIVLLMKESLVKLKIKDGAFIQIIREKWPEGLTKQLDKLLEEHKVFLSKL